MNGTIVRLRGDRGFGFITGEDGREHFFHRANFHGFFDDLVRDFGEGFRPKVTFDLRTSPKGPHAVDVTRVDGGVST